MRGALPILIAALLAAADAFPQRTQSTSSAVSPPAAEDPVSSLAGTFSGTGESNAALDPAFGRNFLISLELRFDNLPRPGERDLIISKDERTGAGARGWAIGLNRERTSLRFQVFWRGEDDGGWFEFDNVEILPRRWYRLTALAMPTNYLSLYLETVPAGDEPSEVKFLGGYDIEKAGVPRTSGVLSLSALKGGKRAMHGQVRQLLVAYPGKLPGSRKDALDFLKGGPRVLAEKLSEEEISLWLTEDGEDVSRYRRKLIVFAGPS